MKKIFIALLTFTAGIAAVGLLKTKQDFHSTPFTAEQNVVEISTIHNTNFFVEDIPNEKVENLKPFFDSFKEDLYDEKNKYQGYSGWFTADNFKGMPEVWTILLDADDRNSNNGKLGWSAMILTNYADGESNDDDNFQSVWIKTEGSHLSFKTNKIRGIEYKFNGEFFKNGKNFADDEKVLKGTLQKIVRGKQVAEFTADFAYAEPHCFH